MRFLLPSVGVVGQIRWSMDPTKCVQVRRGGNETSDFMIIDCKANSADQLFLITENGNIRWAGDLEQCLDIGSGSAGHQAQAQLSSYSLSDNGHSHAPGPIGYI